MEEWPRILDSVSSFFQCCGISRSQHPSFRSLVVRVLFSNFQDAITGGINIAPLPSTAYSSSERPLDDALIEFIERLSIRTVLVEYKVLDQPACEFAERTLLDVFPHLKERGYLQLVDVADAEWF